MQENHINNQYSAQIPYACIPNNPSANAVNINIVSPQAFATCPSGQNYSGYQQSYYPVYGTNTNPNMPLYPQNYNNLINTNTDREQTNSRNLTDDTNLLSKTNNPSETEAINKTEENKDGKKDEKNKKITPLTDEYVKSLENYMNNDNPKVRLIAVKDLIERFKEDENRKDNQSLIPLLNKALRDTNSAVRFLALTALQLGYSVGNDETVSILKEIQNSNKDKLGQDSLLASEILLKLSAPQQVEVKKEAE